MMPNETPAPQPPNGVRPPLSRPAQEAVRRGAALAAAEGARFVTQRHVAVALAAGAQLDARQTLAAARPVMGSELAAVLRRAGDTAVRKGARAVDVEHLRAAVADAITPTAPHDPPPRAGAGAGSGVQSARLLQLLSRRSPLLVALQGERDTHPEREVAGVAALIAAQRVPHALRDARLETFTTAPPLQSLGHRFRSRINDLSALKAPVVVFITDVIPVLDAPGGQDAILTALAAGVRLLTTCDDADASRLAQSAVRRHVQLVPLRAVEQDEAQRAVIAALPLIAAHHDVTIDPDVVPAAVAIAARAAGVAAPGGALDLLEDVCAAVSAGGGTDVTVDELRAHVGADATGVLLRAVPDLAALEHFEDRLHERVVGQDEAVRAVADAIRRAATGVADPDRPLGSFLFLGPTGVGKTELARTLVSTLYGRESALLRLDMGEYQEPHAVARLVGAPPGYVGYEHGGHLSEALRRRPGSVVLLDEIEKAHPDVLNTLLAVLDEGRLTDGYGRTVDARSAIVIMTSNLGSRTILDAGLSFDDVRERVQAAAAQHFPPEFISRVDDVVVFRRLSPDDLRAIVDLHLLRISQRLAQRDVSLQVGDDVRAWLAAQMDDASHGARPLRTILRRNVENTLARAAASGRLARGSSARLHLVDDAIQLG